MIKIPSTDTVMAWIIKATLMYSNRLMPVDWHSVRNGLRLFCPDRRLFPNRVVIYNPVLYLLLLSVHLREGESIAQVLSVQKLNDFETRYKLLYPRVVKYFLKKNVPMEEAEELAQDTFLRIYKNLEKYRQEAKFASWTCIVARNVWKNYIRDKKTDKRDGIQVDLKAVNPVEEPNQTDPRENEPSQKLREAITQLPEKMRRVVELRVYGDLPFAQIAVILKKSEDTVKSQMSHAKKKLGKDLGKQATEE